MQSVLFTKLFQDQTVEEIATHAQEAGFRAIDLLVRPGHQVEPGNSRELAGAIKVLEQQGLAVPMVTTDLVDPEDRDTEAVLVACAESNIGLIRLGYWKYDGSRRYPDCLDTARRQLAGLAGLAGRFGVRLAVQLHGGTIHGSGAQTATLLDGIDPALIGAYPDPGNQAVQDGREDWRFTFDILADRLCCVGVKNGGWFPADLAPSGQRHWQSDWLGLADGMVPWDDVMAYLAGSGYDGPLSFHSHYEVPLAQALDQTQTDLRFIERQIRTSS